MEQYPAMIQSTNELDRIPDLFAQIPEPAVETTLAMLCAAGAMMVSSKSPRPDWLQYRVVLPDNKAVDEVLVGWLVVSSRLIHR